ncbi:MAG: MaoC family dehydratase [Nitrospirota bacterium]|nr:MAG: MaoC family dehydratase [Nitrospirota bacterium]
MIQQLSMEQLKETIGKEIIRGDWIEITQDTINIFADCTNDHQWIHVDAAKAEKGPFGKTIAHGFLVLSLMARSLLEQGVAPAGSKMLINYGLNRLRFTNPVPVGSKIRMVGKLAGVEEKNGGRVLVTIETTMEIQGSEKPAFIADFLIMHFC